MIFRTPLKQLKADLLKTEINIVQAVKAEEALRYSAAQENLRVTHLREIVTRIKADIAAIEPPATPAQPS